MKRLWAYSLLVGPLLFTAPLNLSAREPKAPSPCRDLEKDLDNQVNTLHRRQDAELAQCRKSYGKDDFVCRYVKVTQEYELKQLRDQRQDELSRCRGQVVGVKPVEAVRQNDSCDVYGRNRDHYPHDKYPEPPYKEPPYNEPPKHPPVVHNPPHHDGGGKRGHDPDVGTTRNAGASASSGSSHSSGSSSSSSGSGGSSSSSYHSSSGSGSSSSSSGSSYGSHSSGGASSGGSSSSSSSSSASHSDSGGSRPK
ncbi:MAG TPA: hypothetical protein VFR84_14550 [Candidatus Angelobacter sp.]|nr:hypothetical protein [Candidatus Angelobacter sp.]